MSAAAAAMSDSDDDSVLNMEATFKGRKGKAADRSRSNAMAYIDEALRDDDRRRERQERIERVKKEEADEDIIVKAEKLVASTTPASSAQRRRQIMDEINGIGGEDDGMDQKSRAALALATDTGHSTLLGVRQTFKHTDSSLWHSKEDAVRELNNFLKQCEKEFGSNTNFSRSVMQPLRAAMKQDLLTEFLCNSMIPKLCRYHSQIFLPDEFCKWLFEVACSGGTGTMPDMFSIGAFETLMNLWNDGITTLEPTITMPEVLPRLEGWFGFCQESDLEDKENDTNKNAAIVHPKAIGLRHFLTLSAMSLELHHHKPQCVLKESCDHAVQCLVALERAGLDLTFHSGRRLLEPLQHLIYTVFNSVAAKLSNDRNRWDEWMDLAVERILAQCETLGPGAQKAEDEDDEKAWLCLHLMVRLFPTHTQEGKIHKWQEFRARLAIKALQKCLGSEDWDAHLKSTLLENGNSELHEQSLKSTQWKAITSSYVGLITVELLGSKIIHDDPRCLATVKNAFYCVETAFYLLSCGAPSQDRSKGLYGTVEEADTMTHALSLLENQCQHIEKLVNPMASRPHLRRAAFQLSCMRRYYRYCLDEARTMAGHTGSSGVVQQSLDGWLGKDSDDESDDEPMIT